MKLNIQLFASGTLEFPRKTGDASWKWIQCKIEWTETNVDLTNNTSKLTVKLYGRVGTGGTSGRTWKGYVSIDGTKVINFTDMGSSWADKNVSSTYVLFKSYTQTITHNSDGTKSVALAGSLTGPNSTSISGLTSSGSGTATLDTIPRASEIDSINSGTTDFTPTLYFTPKSADFKYLIKYQYGSYEKYSLMLSPGTTAQQAYAGITIYSSEIGSYMPNVTSGTLTATLYTYQADGTTYVGESSVIFTITLNSNVIPTISIGNPVEADSTMQSLNWGIFVKTKSKLSYSVSASGIYGSSVSSIVNTITGTTTSGTTSVTTNYLTTAGTNTLTSKVTDSRGRSATTTRTINVVDYFSPTIQTFQVQRCDINGNLTDEGEYLYYNLAGRVASCSNHNTGTYKLRYKEKGTSTWSNFITLGTGIEWTGNGILQSGGTKVFFDDIKIYDIDFAVQDTFSTNSSQSELNSVADLMNWNPAGTSMAIGKVSQRTASEKALDIGLDTYIDKNLNVNDTITANNNITANNGMLISAKNGKTISISNENAGYAHYLTDATNGHFFNKNVMVNGYVYAGPNYNQLLAFKDETIPKTYFTSANLDDYQATQFLIVNGATAGVPPHPSAYLYGTMIVQNFASGYSTQFLTDVNTGISYSRALVGGNWTQWTILSQPRTITFNGEWRMAFNPNGKGWSLEIPFVSPMAMRPVISLSNCEYFGSSGWKSCSASVYFQTETQCILSFSGITDSETRGYMVLIRMTGTLGL